jgi:hypothetical protein
MEGWWICQFKSSIASCHIYDSLFSVCVYCILKCCPGVEEDSSIVFIEMLTHLICSTKNAYFLQVHAYANWDMLVICLVFIYEVNEVWIAIQNGDHCMVLQINNCNSVLWDQVYKTHNRIIYILCAFRITSGKNCHMYRCLKLLRYCQRWKEQNIRSCEQLKLLWSYTDCCETSTFRWITELSMLWDWREGWGLNEAICCDNQDCCACKRPLYRWFLFLWDFGFLNARKCFFLVISELFHWSSCHCHNLLWFIRKSCLLCNSKILL